MKMLQKKIISLWKKTPKPYPILSKLQKSYDLPWNIPANILYLGDSVLERTAREDSDTRTVDQMAADLLAGSYSLSCFSRPAYHMKVFYHLLAVLRSMRHQPKMVILPINMRSFSPQWDLNPAWQFEEEIAALKKYSETRRISVLRKNTDGLTFSEKERLLELEYPFTNLKYLGQFLDVVDGRPTSTEEVFYRRKQIYIFHYLHALSSSHRRLMYLKKTLDLLSGVGIKLFTYITPVNYQGGVRHVGNGFIDGIRANVNTVKDVIRPYLQNGNVCFLNFEEHLTSEHFFHPDELTEHLNQFGRSELAKMVTSNLKEAFA